MENVKNNIECDTCKGFGIVKNYKFECVNCHTHRCEYTLNLSKGKFCKFCSYFNPIGSSPNIHCIKCLYEGYYLNNEAICTSCDISHRICNCVIDLFDECDICNGSGIIE